MTPESKVKLRVKKVLDAAGSYYFMPVQMGLGVKTIDFLCCVMGGFVGIETKAKGKEPTPLQLATMQEIEEAGGATFVIDGDAGIKDLELWIECQKLVTLPPLTQGETNG